MINDHNGLYRIEQNKNLLVHTNIHLQKKKDMGEETFFLAAKCQLVIIIFTSMVVIDSSKDHQCC